MHNQCGRVPLPVGRAGFKAHGNWPEPTGYAPESGKSSHDNTTGCGDFGKSPRRIWPLTIILVIAAFALCGITARLLLLDDVCPARVEIGAALHLAGCGQ